MFGINILSIIFMVLVGSILQMSAMRITRKKLIKYLPILMTVFGVLITVIIHTSSGIWYGLDLISKSVMAENQYFAMFIGVPMMAGLLGCLIGIFLVKLNHKVKILYFVPFILFAIIYLIMAFLGFGIISLMEIIWLIVFFTSGLLLTYDKYWGVFLGFIPSVAFIYMSTQSTGQVVNIELPIGIGIAVYYIACIIIDYNISKKTS